MTTAFRSDTAFLHAHGIAVSLATLDKQLAAAVSQLQRTLYGESRDELTEPELRVLEAGGFDPVLIWVIRHDLGKRRATLLLDLRRYSHLMAWRHGIAIPGAAAPRYTASSLLKPP
jgi:hypothetical protein